MLLLLAQTNQPRPSCVQKLCHSSFSFSLTLSLYFRRCLCFFFSHPLVCFPSLWSSSFFPSRFVFFPSFFFFFSFISCLLFLPCPVPHFAFFFFFFVFFFFFLTTAMLRCGSQFSSRCFVFGFCYRVNFERCFNRGI